jgi:hypothetical protein
MITYAFIFNKNSFLKEKKINLAVFGSEIIGLLKTS